VQYERIRSFKECMRERRGKLKGKRKESSVQWNTDFEEVGRQRAVSQVKELKERELSGFLKTKRGESFKMRE
jgi:hypothetical protein